MESVKSSSSIPFRSKKLQSTPKKPAKLVPEDRPSILETPEKSSRPPRVRNQNMALSIKDVKRTVQMIQNRDQNESHSSSDPVRNLRSGSSLQIPALEKRQRGSVKNVERSVQLPEKYLMLCEFFNVMVSVIPLLRMRKKSSSFSNICPKIQSLTDRRFTVNHLAQMKYILPKAIVVKKIQVRDEQTDCMKEELLITLDMEAVKGSKNVKDMREMFRVCIEDYYAANHEENDIPEAELPALFYQSNQSETSTIGKSSCVATASHVPQNFQRSFSRQVSSEKSEDPTVNGSESLVSESSSVLATPIKDSSDLLIDIQGTPVKKASTPIRLMTNTPDIQPSSKRCYMSPDDVSCDVPTKLARRPIRTRSLKFDAPEYNAETEVSNANSDITDLLPRKLLESVREKERKILEEQDPAISEARRRHQLMSAVPKLFDMIHLLFQSINRSVMTKEELLYKMITGHSDIVDRGEVEKQFELLLELAPEYISERSCKSGDTLVCVNKSVTAQFVRAKLSEV